MLVIYKIFSVLFLMLFFVSGFGCFLDKKYGLRDLKTRIFSWWRILPIFAIALIVNGSLLFLFFCFVCFMSFKEFISAIPTRRGDQYLIFLLYLIIPIQLYFAWTHNAEFAHFISLSLFLLMALFAVITGEIKGMVVSVATLYWGLVLTVFCLSFVVYLNAFPISSHFPAGGRGLVLYLVLLTQLNDISQYCWGKFLGGKKIIPRISPQKTISGFLGGIATSALLSIPLGALLVSLPIKQAVMLGALMAVSGFLGDILISGVKRDLEIKDFSILIPGHGGMLDRVDSLILSAPLFFYYLKISGLLSVQH